MAEFNNSSPARRDRGLVRSQKLSTRVDLTPMVDLGFLLITFFVFTTTATQPTAMKLLLPADTKDIIDHTPTPESVALTIIPLANEKVFYYHGDLQKAEKSGEYGVTDFSVTGGIGAVIRQKKNTLDASSRFKRTDLVLIIRPVGNASYKSVVDALDEVLINDVKHYSFVEVTENEIKFLVAHGQQPGGG